MKRLYVFLMALFVAIISFSQTRCKVCNGYGQNLCIACGGNGMIFQYYFDSFWGVWRTVTYPCAGCGCRGSIDCMTCSGRGVIPTRDSGISFKAGSTLYYLYDKNKKCYNKSTYFETYQTHYSIVLSDKCINCHSSYRNH